MTAPRSIQWAAPAIRIAAAGLGAAVAGPLGGALGGWLGDAFGPSAATLIKGYARKFGEKAAEKLLDTGGDSLLEKLKAPSPPFEAVYREALRLSLAEIGSQVRGDGLDDWFANWDRCLAGSTALDLSAIDVGQFAPEKLDDLFRQTMERLDRQGSAMRRNDLSLTTGFRTMPDALFFALKARLPGRLQEKVRALIVTPQYEQAWKQARLAFEDFASTTLRRIDETTQTIDHKTDVLPQVAEDVAALRKLGEELFKSARREGRVTNEQLQAKDAEIARLTEELRKLQGQLATRASEPGEAELLRLIASGDLPGAVRLKTQQVNARRSEADKLPQDLFELGSIHQLRFDWPKALAAYREAWRLKQKREYGFSYAYCAQRQNQFSEAIDAYQILLKTHMDPPDVAMTLNNLANLYSATQRMKEAEGAYQEALSTYRELAKANPEAYLPDVAMTLNNLAILYRATQRMKEAEECCREAECLLEPLWRANPEVHGDQIARILCTRALLCEPLGKSRREACVLARRAFAAAYHPYLKQSAQALLDRLCADDQP